MFGMNEVKFDRVEHREDVNRLTAKFETTLGDFELELFHDKAPLAVWNFVNLAEGRQENVKNGPYYDGLIFHRIIDGFMIQGGCPNGMGTGGPGYEFANEDHEQGHDSEGILAMANRGRDTNGSQFYITLAPQPALDGGYTVFGKIIEGMDTVKSIGGVATNPYNDKPEEDVVIKKVTIIRH